MRNKSAPLLTIILLILFCFSVQSKAQNDEQSRSMNQPVEPFKIIGNIYYVGASDVTSFLITTRKGHILIDGGFAETAPQIKRNILKLGFRLEDVKILLNSHAHLDHAGGLAEIKELTGARLFASQADSLLLANGGKGDFSFGDRLSYPPVRADKILRDNEKVKLGEMTLKANLTPGHTKGCTTWTTTVFENKQKYNVVFVCSTTAPGYRLVDNQNYPNIVHDYQKTFRKLKKIKADVFLASHGNFFDLADKIKKLQTGVAVNPFIDPQGYIDFINKTEQAFQEKLREQQNNKRQTVNLQRRITEIAQNSKGLSPPSRALLLKLMIETPTGEKRLKGLLPKDTVFAHKTGTSSTVDGITAATNDIGLITLPDGRYSAVAVFVSDSPADEATREAVIAQIACTVFENF